MSVRKGDRSESKLSVLNDIRVLADYTIRACRNEKIFPKSSRWVLAQPIVRECVDAMTCVRRANAVYVVTRADYELRRQYQMDAHAHLDALLSLVDLAFNVYDIDSGKIEYWTGLTLSADDKVKAWIKSDRERNVKLLG